MALRGTLTHRKTRRLAKLLNINQCFALGLVEALWHVTAEQKPNGAIGQMSNQDIADELFYDGDPDVVVNALISAGFVDVCDHNRLVIHDWSRHADQWVKRKLARHGQPFAVVGQSCLAMASLPEPEPVPEPEPEPDIPPNPRKRGQRSTRRERQRDDEARRVADRRRLDAERKRQEQAAAAQAQAERLAALKLWAGLSPDEQQARVDALMRQKRWQIAGVDLARDHAIASMLKRSN